MDRFFYQNEPHHYGLVYQNPTYIEPHYPNPYLSRNEVSQKELPLATIYVRPQVYNGVNTPDVALKQGTAFPELYRPFVKRRHP